MKLLIISISIVFIFFFICNLLFVLLYKYLTDHVEGRKEFTKGSRVKINNMWHWF